MTILILAIGIYHIIWGFISIIYEIFDPTHHGDSAELLVTVICVSLEKIGTFIVVWLISIKYWVTIHQLTFFLRSNEASATKEILRARHEKYAFRKKIGIAIVCTAVILRALFYCLTINYT